MISLLGFLPDVDPVTPGAIKDCNHIIPTTKGMKAAPSALDAGVTAASDVTNSLFATKKLDDTTRTFVGTDETLEESSGGDWVDRSGDTYSCGTDYRWSFAQFGNYTLAANRGDVMQVSVSTTFADIAGSPQARYIAVNQGFVMAVNLSTAADGWHCSAYQDHTDWTGPLSTQSTSGRIISDNYFTGVKSFGDGFVAWKKNSTYLATYVGSPVVFDFSEIPGDVGCPDGSAAVDIGDRIAFVGNGDDFYIFDGANNIPIGAGIREWFFTNLDPQNAHRTIATYNRITANITWHFVSNAAGDNNPNMAVVYNIHSNKWGKYALTIEAASSSYIAPGLTYDDFGAEYLTWDDAHTDISYDSPVWLAGVALSGVMLTDHILYTLTGVPPNSTFTLNTFGDDEAYSTVTRVRPRFITAPQSSTINYSYDDEYGDQFSFFNTFDLKNGKYDLMHSARWHEVKYNFVGNMEIIGTNVSIVMDGTQ